MKLLLIGFFGLLGVFARYFFGLMVSKVFQTQLPLATFCINLIGAFLIGALFVIGQEKAMISHDVRTSIMVGFLGGFTTFSSFCLEALKLAEEGKLFYCFIYLGGSPVLGLSATYLGVFLARKFL
jgi:CrcB protein